MSSCNQHPLDQLAFEVQALGEKLSQASVRRPENQPRQQEPRRLESNLNQNANNGTFLFSSRSPQHHPPASRETTRPSNPSRASRTTSEPPRSGQRFNSKHTFLFGHQQESQSVQRYIPSPSAKNPKHPGQTHWSVDRRSGGLLCLNFWRDSVCECFKIYGTNKELHQKLVSMHACGFEKDNVRHGLLLYSIERKLAWHLIQFFGWKKFSPRPPQVWSIK